MSQRCCIFCSHVGGESDYHEEHIIPKNIRGNWVLDGCVCRKCNNDLGSEVDPQIWRVPDVVRAHDELNIPYDANVVFKKHYVANAFMGEKPVPFKAKWTPDGIRLQPYPHRRDDGVMIYPINDYEIPLHRNLQRKDGYCRSSVDELIQEISTAPPGTKIEHPPQAQHFIKGIPEEISVDLNPKDCQVDRLVAKIALEFLYITTGKILMCRPKIVDPLRQLSRYGNPDDTVSVRRVKSDRNGFEAFHSITSYLNFGSPRIYVTFFGYIVYELLVRLDSDDGYLNEIRHEIGLPDLIGFDFEQEILSPSHRLRVWLSGDRYIVLAAL